jgi:hypothetical protein
MERIIPNRSGAFVERSQKNLADSASALCPICGEPVDASQTAVAVLQSNGVPGLVHPACYPLFSVQQRERGNMRYADSPFRGPAATGTGDAPAGQ